MVLFTPLTISIPLLVFPSTAVPFTSVPIKLPYQISCCLAPRDLNTVPVSRDEVVLSCGKTADRVVGSVFDPDTALASSDCCCSGDIRADIIALYCVLDCIRDTHTIRAITR